MILSMRRAGELRAIRQWRGWAAAQRGRQAIDAAADQHWWLFKASAALRVWRDWYTTRQRGRAVVEYLGTRREIASMSGVLQAWGRAARTQRLQKLALLRAAARERRAALQTGMRQLGMAVVAPRGLAVGQVPVGSQGQPDVLQLTGRECRLLGGLFQLLVAKAGAKGLRGGSGGRRLRGRSGLRRHISSSSPPMSRFSRKGGWRRAAALAAVVPATTEYAWGLAPGASSIGQGGIRTDARLWGCADAARRGQQVQEASFMAWLGLDRSGAPLMGTAGRPLQPS